MTAPHDPQPAPADEPELIADEGSDPWIEIPPDPPVVPAPERPVSVRPVTQRMGPRAVATPVPPEETSRWAVAGFLLGGLTLLVILFGGGYWGLSSLRTSQAESRERAQINRTDFGNSGLSYTESVMLFNQLRPLETDDERAQDLRTGFAVGELGTDEATAHELELMLERVARAEDSDPISGHLSRPHLIRRILPLVPQKLRADFGLAPERLMSIGYSEPEVNLVRVRPWNTGDANEEGRVVYAQLRSVPNGGLLPFRFWVVREAGVWKCVDYELTYYGLSAAEMATLRVCTLMCPAHPGGAILQRESDMVDPKTIKQPERELEWIDGQINQVPITLRDSTMILALQSLHDAGLSYENWEKELAELPESTRSIYRGEMLTRRHLRTGHAEACLQECDAFRTRFGDTSDSVQEARVQALLELGRFDEALVDLESLTVRYPTETDLIPLLALACRAGDIQPLATAVLRHPLPGEAIPRAYSGLTASRGTESVNQFIEALALAPRCRAHVAQLRYWQAERSGDKEAALEAMRQAVEFADDSQRDEFRQSQFHLMLTHGQTAEACGLYSDDEKLVEILMGSLEYEETWPYEKESVRPLLDPLKRLTAARPQDHQAWYLLGTTHASLEEWDDAIAAFAHSMKVQPVDKPGAEAQSPASPEPEMLAHYSWISALQSAGRWQDLESVMEKSPAVGESLSQSLSWSTQTGLVEWAQRFVAEHPESPQAARLNAALAVRAEDWGTARKELATLIDREKDETKLDGLRRQLAMACINDPDLGESSKEIRTSQTLNFACQALLQRGDTRTLLQLIAILKAARPPRGVRNRLPFWEAHAWAQIGRYAEFSATAIEKLFQNPPEEDIDAIQALSDRWDGQTPGTAKIEIGIGHRVLPPGDPQYNRIQLALAVRMRNIGQLQNSLPDREHQDLLQELYTQPAYAALWSDEFRPVRELAPPQLRSTYYPNHRLILLEPGEAPDSGQWDARISGLTGELGRAVDIVPLSVSKESPARQAHWVREGNSGCLIAIGSEPADDFKENESYTSPQLTPEHKDLLRTHRWWVQVWSRNPGSPEDDRFSESVAAALIQERTLAVYHDGFHRAYIGKGPLEFRAAAREVDRFAHSVLPWTELDLAKLKQSGEWTGTFWWGGPKRVGPEPEPVPPVPESKSLYERFRACPADQVLRATVRNDREWIDAPLEVEVERIVIVEGQLQSARCRVVTPSPLSRQLAAGDPVEVWLYRLDDVHQVPRGTGGRIPE